MADLNSPRTDKLLRFISDPKVSFERKMLALRNLANRRVYGKRFKKFVKSKLSEFTRSLVLGSRQERLSAYQEFADLCRFDEDMRAEEKKGESPCWRSVFRETKILKLLKPKLRQISRESDHFSAGLAALLLEEVAFPHLRALRHFLRYSETSARRHALGTLGCLAPKLSQDELNESEAAFFREIIRGGETEEMFHFGAALGQHFCLRGLDDSRIGNIMFFIERDSSAGAAAFLGICFALGERAAGYGKHFAELLLQPDTELTSLALRTMPNLGLDGAIIFLPMLNLLFERLEEEFKMWPNDLPDELIELHATTLKTIAKLIYILGKAQHPLPSSESEESVQG